MIVAMSENRVIGRDGDLPWRLSADLKRFKKITMGHHLIMGRKTWDSIGRPLLGRTSVVISRTKTINHEGVLTARSIEDAIELCGNDAEPFVIGGAQIFDLALPVVKTIYLTTVHANIEGDVFLTELDLQEWDVADTCTVNADEKNEFDHTNETLRRIDGRLK
ncbi:UNVERIFIED_CONTAM: hypothetical protein GTU68_033678 [Idotea baltica]|nr:hypothetical protein [Idotea baltica]